jgi:hypothetical protein
MIFILLRGMERELVSALFKRQSGKCNNCKRKVKNPLVDRSRPNFDYKIRLIVPNSKKGLNSIENKVMLCRECAVSSELRPVATRIPNHLYSDLISWRDEFMPEATVSETIHVCIEEKLRGARKNPDDDIICNLKKQVEELESRFAEMQNEEKMYKMFEYFRKQSEERRGYI